jgi:hypothetical protein
VSETIIKGNVTEVGDQTRSAKNMLQIIIADLKVSLS